MSRVEANPELAKPKAPAMWQCACGYIGKKMRGRKPRPSTKRASWCPSCLEQC